MTYVSSKSNNMSNQHYVRNNYNMSLHKEFKQFIIENTDENITKSKEMKQYTVLLNSFSRAYIIR